MTDLEIIARVRLLLGQPDQEMIPDLIIQTFLDIQKLQFNYPTNQDNLPYVIYNTLVSCVQWLITRQVTSGESSVTKRREKIGQEEIEVNFSEGYMNSWEDLLEYLTAHPEYVDPSLSGSRGLVIIGGVRESEYRRVRNDFNGRDTYSSGSLHDRRCNDFPWPFNRR